jgi:hypothetical protein
VVVVGVTASEDLLSGKARSAGTNDFLASEVKKDGYNRSTYQF